MSEIVAKVAQAIIDAHRERVDAFTVARRAIEAMRGYPKDLEGAEDGAPYPESSGGYNDYSYATMEDACNWWDAVIERALK